MLHIVLSVQTNRMGVVNDDTQTVLIPLEYKNIIFQKHGIVAEDFNSISSAFSFDGHKIITQARNILFLNDNYMLAASTEGKTFVFNYATGERLNQTPFDAVLVFIGSSQQAQLYNGVMNLLPIFNSPDYNTYGAHIEDLLCAQINLKWGVFNIQTKTFQAPFMYPHMVQCTRGRIAVRDPQSGGTLML